MNANVYIFHLKKAEEQELFSSMFWPTSGQISQCPSILHSNMSFFFYSTHSFNCTLYSAEWRGNQYVLKNYSVVGTSPSTLCVFVTLHLIFKTVQGNKHYHQSYTYGNWDSEVNKYGHPHITSLKMTEGFKLHVFLTLEHLLFPLVHEEWEGHRSERNNLFLLFKTDEFWLYFIHETFSSTNLSSTFFSSKIIFAQFFTRW